MSQEERISPNQNSKLKVLKILFHVGNNKMKEFYLKDALQKINFLRVILSVDSVDFIYFSLLSLTCTDTEEKRQEQM